MQQFPADQLVLLSIETALLIALIVRIWSARLFRVYPYFFSYLLMELIQAVVSWLVPYNSLAYIYCWVGTEAVIACLYVLIVGELYRVVLRDLRGIASISRRYLKLTLVIAICLSLLLLRMEEAPANLVSTFLVIERAIVLSVLIFILLVTAFLVYYPVPLSRNAVVYSIGYAVYFLTKATGLLIRTLGHYVLHQVGDVLMAVSIVCLLFWVISLSRSGETRVVVVGHKWNPEDEQRLLSRIKAINEHLGGVEQSTGVSPQYSDKNVK